MKQFLGYPLRVFTPKSLQNPSFEGKCYDLKGLELFSKTNFESSLASEGLKICKIMYFMLSFWFDFLPLPPKQIDHSSYFKKEEVHSKSLKILTVKSLDQRLRPLKTF